MAVNKIKGHEIPLSDTPCQTLHPVTGVSWHLLVWTLLHIGGFALLPSRHKALVEQPWSQTVVDAASSSAPAGKFRLRTEQEQETRFAPGGEASSLTGQGCHSSQSLSCVLQS